MEVTLRNAHLQATIETLGAELWSLRNLSTGLEYIWQGDSQYWARHAPVLFPVVGRLVNNEYTYNGLTYKMPQHGFARDMEFRVIEQSAERAVFELWDNAETHAKYPFRFRLLIFYHLIDQTLHIGYEVSNPGDGDLLFSLGAHPGFRVPLARGESYEEYTIQFEKEEHLQRDLLQDGLLTGKLEPVPLTAKNHLMLHHDLFQDDALVFHDVKSESVCLCNRQGNNGVRVRMAGWPHLGIWAKPGAPFVCIEPWHGHADLASHSGELSQKVGITRLAAGQLFQTSYSIEAL